MTNQIEFCISDLAYDGLIDLLKIHNEYSYVKFCTITSCCNHSKIQIILDDKIDANDKILDYKDLKLVYNPSNLKDFYKITLIHEDDTFKVKAESNNKTPNCKACTHKSGNCVKCTSN